MRAISSAPTPSAVKKIAVLAAATRRPATSTGLFRARFRWAPDNACMSSFSLRAGDRPPRMSRRRIEAVAATLVPGLLLAACAGGAGTAKPVFTSTVKAPPPTPALSPPRGGATTLPTQPLRVTEKMTRPGIRLRFGQKAIVPVREYNALRKSYIEGVLGIVVRRIRQTRGSRVEGNFDPPAGLC
jgi:hypothetical protein